MSPNDPSESNEASTPERKPATAAFGPPHLHHVKHEPTDPDVLAKLEWLDDLMFEAIDGDPTALETAIDAWQKSLNELGPDALEESRLQYLRRAQSVWNELRNEPNHPPHKVFAAIEVISLLAVKAW
ncbi:MAG: hypothetical protein L0228_17605 [Planctomycetes bacterium]|nr:hypothetical protein [Planctomycetota bacterium]